jgi:hypothetical protein
MTSQPCHPEGNLSIRSSMERWNRRLPMVISEAAIYFSTRIKSPLDAFTATFSL